MKVAVCGLPFSGKKISRFLHTWREIASSRTEEGAVNEALEQKILELKQYWKAVESTSIPHTFYFLTNKKHPPRKKSWIESELNYYMTFEYHYLAQKAIVQAVSEVGLS